MTEALKNQVFEYFKEICSIPHGSGDMDKICKYCVDFAIRNGLDYYTDDAHNVVIYKDGTGSLENKQPIILQGHLDMVCQKTLSSEIDFKKDGIKVYEDGDFLKADGTTLGADNGIAVAMIMTILASDELIHPPIEAVFTTDEEIGMIGAEKLDILKLKGKRLINIDSEVQDVVTVSCAGGSDVKFSLPLDRVKKRGNIIRLFLKGLKGGHSGVEIDKGRVNANILMGRILNHLQNKFYLISINGGDKGNAIPNSCEAMLLSENSSAILSELEEYLNSIKKEIADREEGFSFELQMLGEEEALVIGEKEKSKLVFMLLSTPNGVVDMSFQVEGLVETSLNLGILKTNDKDVFMQYALRSNKKSALFALEEKMISFGRFFECDISNSGTYLPWEYRENSALRDLYIRLYSEKFGKAPKVEALHAGLECAVFSAKIMDIDCISIGPDTFDVHTTDERLSISSTGTIFELLCKILSNLY